MIPSFYNSAKILDHNKVFIRDVEQAWNQAGLPGIARDVNATADYLRSLIGDIKPKRCFFVGNSMGGYAAILFHALLGTGRPSPLHRKPLSPPSGGSGTGTSGG